MAKRLLSTDIWLQDWFIKMPPEYMHLWHYVLTTCDHAGIWKPEKALLEKLIGAQLDLKIALDLFNKDKNRIHVLKNKRWCVVDFLSFQYGEHLNTGNRVHASALAVLRANKIDPAYQGKSIKGFDLYLTSIRPQLEDTSRLKDKDKEKDKEKDKDIVVFKERGMGKTKIPAALKSNDDDTPGCARPQKKSQCPASPPEPGKAEPKQAAPELDSPSGSGDVPDDEQKALLEYADRYVYFWKAANCKTLPDGKTLLASGYERKLCELREAVPLEKLEDWFRKFNDKNFLQGWSWPLKTPIHESEANWVKVHHRPDVVLSPNRERIGYVNGKRGSVSPDGRQYKNGGGKIVDAKPGDFILVLRDAVGDERT